jgi:hypothetical protein
MPILRSGSLLATKENQAQNSIFSDQRPAVNPAIDRVSAVITQIDSVPILSVAELVLDTSKVVPSSFDPLGQVSG